MFRWHIKPNMCVFVKPNKYKIATAYRLCILNIIIIVSIFVANSYCAGSEKNNNVVIQCNKVQ